MKKILEHERNQHIEFSPEHHTYLYKGETPFKGITKWIGKYTKPFDAEKVAGSLIKWHKDYIGRTVEEVLQEWQGETDYGNEVHYSIENYVNHGIDNQTVELQAFKQFLADYELTPIITEWVVYDESINRASAIDLVCKDRDDKVVLVDIKTMRKPIDIKSYKDVKMSYPLNSLPDSRYYKQCLQLGIYQKWVKELYKIETTDNPIVLRVRDDFYEVYTMMDVRNEIEKLYEFEKG
jgi:hypothetical protein